MFEPIQGFIDYLNPHNFNRITGLSIRDPFAIVGFILLLITVLVAMILLTITSRRSAESIWDGIEHDSRFRALHRSARRSTLLTNMNRGARRSIKPTIRIKRVSFTAPSLPPVPETPGTPFASDTEPMLLRSAAIAHSAATRPLPLQRVLSSPVGSTFEDVYDRWIQARRPPQVDVIVEDIEAHCRWTSEFQEELRRTAVEMV